MIEGQCHCGAVRWRLDAMPDHATACTCTVCRRHGALWAYGYEGDDVHPEGKTAAYIRGDRELAFHFCPTCGCTVWWRGIAPGETGRHRIAVNLRMAEPGDVAAIPLHHFDGLERWESLPDKGDCVADLWA